MELRRALLLFAVVLGLGAVVTSFTRPPEPRRQSDRPGERGRPPDSTSPAAPQPRAVRTVRFSARGRPRRVQLDPGRPATVTVEVDAPGQAELEGLDLVAPAEPLTPAHFELLLQSPRTSNVLFTRAGAGEPRKVGVLEVRG